MSKYRTSERTPVVTWEQGQLIRPRWHQKAAVQLDLQAESCLAAQWTSPPSPRRPGLSPRRCWSSRPHCRRPESNPTPQMDRGWFLHRGEGPHHNLTQKRLRLQGWVVAIFRSRCVAGLDRITSPEGSIFRNPPPSSQSSGCAGCPFTRPSSGFLAMTQGSHIDAASTLTPLNSV